MANPSKQKGTAWESAIVSYLHGLGVQAKRIVLHGNKDEGDIEVTSDAILAKEFHIEAKNCNTITLAAWVDEARVEGINAGVPVVVVAKRKGRTSPEHAYVITELPTFLRLTGMVE